MMFHPEIKAAILELTSLAMQIQDESSCLVEINIHHSVGIWSVCISNEYDRRISYQENMYEDSLHYGDEYHNEFFRESYLRIKERLEEIYTVIDKVY
jgi:hypothetical protein